MPDLVLVQAPDKYDRTIFARMIDILENKFSNISTVFAQVSKSAYQLDAQVTPAGNVTTGVTTLMTYTMPANTLGKVGYNVNIEAYGTFAANAHAKQIILYFGSTVLYDSTSLVLNGGTWFLSAIVTRTSSATEQAIVTVTSSNTTIVNSVFYVVPAEDLTLPIVIKCTGTATSTNDIIEKGQLIRVFPKE